MPNEKNPRSEAKSKSETVAHYRDLRRICYETTAEKYAHLHLSFSEISLADAAEGDGWRAQWNDPQRVPQWSWVHTALP